MAAPLIARLIRFGGGRLLDRVVGRVLPAGKAKAPVTPAGSGLAKGLASAALVRLATRSVPGAIVVGGGFLAKLLYDRRHAKVQTPAATSQPPAPRPDDDTDVLG